MYDLIIKGGTVVDPTQNLNGAYDVAIEDGKIAAVAAVAADISADEAARVVEVKGKYVTAGLIDLHTHVYEGVNGNGVNADVGGVRAGVTTMVDAGSSGCDTYGGFPAHIIPGNATEIIPFLHICRTGLATTPDIFAPSSIDLERTIQVIKESNGTIPRHQGAHGFAGPGDYGHGDAPSRQARRQRSRRSPDGAHRRHREALPG